MARKPINYWEKRSTELMKRIEKRTENTINSLIKAYEQATKDINKEIAKIFKNYAKDNVLSKDILRQMLNKKETDTYYKNLLQVINNNITDKRIKKKMLAKYNAPAYSYRISRYQALQNNIDVELRKLADIEQEITKIRYIDTIKEGYYHNIYDIQKGSGLGFSFAQIDDRTINLLLNENWVDNGNFSKRIWNNSEKLGNYLRTQFTADSMSGKSIQNISKELAEFMNVGLYNATTLVRTEVNHFANQAELLSYKECGIEKYVYIATLDKVTCSHCAKLDGKKFFVKDAKEGVNYPNLHVNDRCTTISYFDEKELENLTRIARDPITGKNYYVDQNMTYDEWKEQIDIKYAKGTVDLEHKKYTNLKTDKEQYKRYKKVLEKEFVPEKFEKFQDLKYNNIEKYNDLKDYYRYKSNYPESNREFYEVNNKVKQLINIEQVKEGIGTAVKPNVKDIKISSINTHAEKRMQQRQITKDMAQSYIYNAVIEFVQNNKRLYISDKGATVLLQEDKRLITTYNTFDEDILKIMEIINGRRI